MQVQLLVSCVVAVASKTCFACW